MKVLIIYDSETLSGDKYKGELGTVLTWDFPREGT